jgi:hypothetical protein
MVVTARVSVCAPPEAGSYADSSRAGGIAAAGASRMLYLRAQHPATTNAVSTRM